MKIIFNKLVQRAKEGEVEAVEEVVKRLQPLLVASIRRYYNKKDQYQDLMQDGNLTILESIREYDSKKGVYFLGFVKSKIKYLYLNKHREKYCSSLNEKVGDGDLEIIDLLEEEEVDFLGGLIQEEDRRQLARALEGLTKRQGQIIDLFYQEKMTLGEIADRLGISYRTVVNLRVNALAKLRDQIKKEGDKK